MAGKCWKSLKPNPASPLFFDDDGKSDDGITSRDGPEMRPPLTAPQTEGKNPPQPSPQLSPGSLHPCPLHPLLRLQS